MRLPNRTITFLSVGCGALVAAYVALVAVTVFYATVRTDHMMEARSMESRVAALETEYYDSISRLSATDVTAEGYVTPQAVEYVAALGAPAVTRAAR